MIWYIVSEKRALRGKTESGKPGDYFEKCAAVNKKANCDVGLADCTSVYKEKAFEPLKKYVSELIILPVSPGYSRCGVVWSVIAKGVRYTG